MPGSWMMILLTFAILLLLGVLLFVLVFPRGTLRKRRLAQSVHEVGAAPRDILARAWTGTDYRGLDDQLRDWTREIETLAQLHRSYPMLHYFPAPDRNLSFSLAIANLDETVSLLKFIVPEAQRPPPRILLPLRRAIDQLLDGLGAAGVNPSAELPPLPHLPASLDYSDSKLKREYVRITMDRRRLLRGWVEHDRRDWPEGF